MKHLNIKTMVLGLLCCCGFAGINAQTNTGNNAQNPPGFPAVKATGNAQTDAANYAAAKEEWYKNQENATNVTDNGMPWKNDAEKEAWIQANPEEYSKLSGNNEGAEKVNLAEKEYLQSQQIEVLEISLAEFNAWPVERQNFLRENKNLVRVKDANGNVITNF